METVVTGYVNDGFAASLIEGLRLAYGTSFPGIGVFADGHVVKVWLRCEVDRLWITA